MKKALLFSLFMVCSLCLKAQVDNPGFDKALADSLGADEYGMKPYILVILKTGTNKVDDPEKVSSLFRGHLDNINRLASLNKLVVAGPIKPNEKSYRGIFILNVPGIAEAEALLETDPAVKEKLLEVELYEWYGSAALPVYLETSKIIAKKNP